MNRHQTFLKSMIKKKNYSVHSVIVNSLAHTSYLHSILNPHMCL
ncbi:hypothetical protein M8C21_001104 [Ambrosia artemisiifolia]|uniref:Uncharacterized protein n=1 Tax=Ambrosia artemisiifolia TaxID=4212 RepID=A0AAD5BUC4_AMBAR|nr:hypothetical protein M8C21_001104 [Ambrosia artemisiifolia]